MDFFGRCQKHGHLCLLENRYQASPSFIEFLFETPAKSEEFKFDTKCCPLTRRSEGSIGLLGRDQSSFPCWSLTGPEGRKEQFSKKTASTTVERLQSLQVSSSSSSVMFAEYAIGKARPCTPSRIIDTREGEISYA